MENKQDGNEREWSQIEQDVGELRQMSDVLGVCLEKADESAAGVIRVVRARLLEMAGRFDALFDQGTDQINGDTCAHPVLLLRGMNSRGTPRYRCATGACNTQIWIRSHEPILVEEILEIARDFDPSEQEEFIGRSLSYEDVEEDGGEDG